MPDAKNLGNGMPNQPEQKVCQTCGGSKLFGYVHGQRMPCTACNGTGKVADKMSVIEGASLRAAQDSTRLQTDLLQDPIHELGCQTLIEANNLRDDNKALLALIDDHELRLEALLAQSYKQGQRDELERFYRWVENHYNSAALITALSERLVELNQGEDDGE